MSASSKCRELFPALTKVDGATLKTALRRGKNESGMLSCPETHAMNTSGLTPNNPAQSRASKPAEFRILCSIRRALREMTDCSGSEKLSRQILFPQTVRRFEQPRSCGNAYLDIVLPLAHARFSTWAG